MVRSAHKFAELLTEGVHRIRLAESKTIRIVQDELGYALEREGGSPIEFWRKGHIPPKMREVEILARQIVRRGNLGREWLEAFLDSADYPRPARLVSELFPTRSGPQAASPIQNQTPITSGAEPVPFIVGPPILSPRNFFGRNDELNRIFNLWRRFPLQNVAVIGLKRSGKTSLLHYLKNITTTPPEALRPRQKSDWLPQPERYRWVFVDFQDARMGSRERLLTYLLTSLKLPVPEPCDLHNFLDIVSEGLTSPTLILMDEINAALASPELDLPFWSSLRSLGTNLTGGNLAFLLTSDESPAQLAHEQGKPSPFFNIFGHSFRLKPLQEEEARDLIANSPRPFPPADIEWILEHSGRWPLLLQILGHARLTALEIGEIGEGWKQEGRRQMRPYRYLLSNR